MLFLSLMNGLKAVVRGGRELAPRSAGRPARLAVERLEVRAVPANLLYTLSNDPDPGENSVLAYRQDPATGGLALVGQFPTGGTGRANPAEFLGPDDNDQPLIVSPDRRFLFAVNGGSDDITVFAIRPTGYLVPVGDEPFPSGGQNPVSVGLSGDTLVVVNQGGDDLGRDTGAPRPNYTSMRVTPRGELRPIPGSTIAVSPGAAPAHALDTPNGRFVYSTKLFADAGPDADQSVVRGLRIRPNGRLEHVALQEGGPGTLWIDNQVHPTRPILYTGFAGSNQLGVWTYDRNGDLSFVRAVPNSGQAICWMLVTPDGQRMYTVNQFDNSVSVYSLADPLNPVEVQYLALRNSGPPPDVAMAGTVSSAPTQVALSPDGRFLYVIGQENRLDNSFPGNQLHVLAVGPDGRLAEPTAPVPLPGSAEGAHPQGVVVLPVQGPRRRGDDRPSRARADRFAVDARAGGDQVPSRFTRTARLDMGPAVGTRRRG